jgi:putative PIN family toxin of toxin-antitoxin system
MIQLPLRVVLDTNLVLSALVFQQGRLASLRSLWQTGKIIPLASRVTAAELIRTLAYPKFRLTSAEQEELLADYLPYCTVVTIPEPPPATPNCRDLADTPFLQLALAGKADCLVTGDKDLLVLAESFACRIFSAEAFLAELARHG